jgi:pimeloyl-ACP methyl ester carboxylesterase
LVSCLLLVAFGSIRTALAVDVADFIEYSLRASNGTLLLPGRLYVPPEAANLSAPRPVITFLHGGALAGTDNVRQLGSISDNMLAEAKQRGAFLYAPQTPTNWADSTALDRVVTMLNQAVGTLNADANRWYVGGHSNGGGGTWNLLSRNPGRFAAAFPIAAVSPASGFTPANLVDTPIFAIHARTDDVVSVSTTRNVVNSILAADREPLPSYPPFGNVSIFLVSNPALEFHREFRNEVHAFDATIDHFVTDPSLDLIYLELPAGGHSGPLGVTTAPELYEWMFAYSTVPEPSALSAVLTGIMLLPFSGRVRRQMVQA